MGRIPHRLAVAATLAVVLTAAGCTRDPTAGPATPTAGTTSAPTGAQDRTVALTVDGVEREYLLHVPPGTTGPIPLVVMLHGGGGSARQARNAYGWDDVADREGFAVAYPDGLHRAWNVGGGCCGQPGTSGSDDVGFVGAVVQDAAGRLPVDPARVYATGMSNGAMMTHRLACDTDLFAAVAPVAGTRLGDCADPAPISLLEIHGTADDRVLYDGSPSVVGPAHIDGPPVVDLVADWRAIDDCPAPQQSTTGNQEISTAECPGGRTVELVTIDGGGHEWPEDATEEIWAFFAAHPG
ncbi:polyhydroxybutyrate depolymerase [Nakamurella sp. YIM 132087]|uniref:Polyhydroxybutyrate depolymerase n=1 Tax=Nakamurella alba TaxID=2665158 RepID=A0A7K1FQL4_9ACTN|nr:PHB depolymerase family esterase [Nakamurella alba]MTD16360.1 polyhydroxybutyrate depolymerase [Nakamurella alba]